MTKKIEDMSVDELRAKAALNSQSWHSADATGKNALHAENVAIYKLLDSKTGSRSSYDPASGSWSEVSAAPAAQTRTAASAAPTAQTGSAASAATARVSPVQETFHYSTAPEWKSAYADEIAALTDSYVRREPFQYDPDADPAWSAYRKMYAREGQRAAANTLGEYAAMTGGMPGTAAMSAAQQAGDYYASQAADKLPALAQLAYEMYLSEGERQLGAINALRGLESDEYSRYRQQLAQYNADRDFSYALSRDAVSDARYADETQYSRSQDAYARELALAQLAAGAGDYSGMENLGVDVSAARPTAYGYSADGDTYTISSAKGLSFLNAAAPGSVMTGGDGSVWTKNADGSVSITKGDRTYLAGGTGASQAPPSSGRTNARSTGSAAPDYNGVLTRVIAMKERGAGKSTIEKAIAAARDAGQITASQYTSLHNYYVAGV